MLLPECTRVPRRFMGYGAYGLYRTKKESPSYRSNMLK